MGKHSEFIKTPITSVLKEMVSGISCVGAGIETYPLWDYVLQSTFIKMTGFLEQKIKCIDWELATNGYDYRRKYLKSIGSKGEYSDYSAKSEVYKALIGEMYSFSGKTDREIIKEIEKDDSFEIIDEVCKILKNSPVISARQRDYEELKTYRESFKNHYLYVADDRNNKSKQGGKKLSYLKLFWKVIIKNCIFRGIE